MLHMPESTTEYLVQDQLGQLLLLNSTSNEVKTLVKFHSGAISAMDTSPKYHRMASLGVDGSLRIYDYIQKQLISQTKYSESGTSMGYLPTSLESTGSGMVLGFKDGIIRFVSDTQSGTVLRHVLKPHTS